MAEIHFVQVQIEPPKGKFAGRVVEGAYIIEGGEVILVDRHGNQVQDDMGKKYRQKLPEGGNAKQLAGIMTKQLRRALRGPNATPRGFSGPLRYPNLGKI